MVSSHTSRAVFAGLTGAAALWSVPTLAMAAPAAADSTLVAGASAAAGFAVGAACVALVSHRGHRAQSEALEARIRLLEAQVAAQAAGTQAIPADPLREYADASTQFAPSEGSASYAPADQSAQLLFAEEEQKLTASQTPEAVPAEKDAASAAGPVASKVDVSGLLHFPDKSGSLPKIAEEGSPLQEPGYHSKHAKRQGESFSVDELLARWQSERAAGAEAAEGAVATPAAAEIEPEPVAMATPEVSDTAEQVAAPEAAGFSAGKKVPHLPELETAPESAAPQVAEASGDRAGIHAAASVDYERVASEYLDRKSFKNRMLALSKGVSRVLAERLGGDMMDDLPMIQRADGTVADLGTSWWEAAAQANDLEISRDLGVELGGLFDTGTVLETAEEAVNAVSATANFQKPFSFATERYGAPAEKRSSATSAPAAAPASSKTAPEAAAQAQGSGSIMDTDAFLAQVGYTSKVVAQAPVVSSEIFPETELNLDPAEDVWQEALDAMDVRFDDNLVSGSRRVSVKIHSSAPESVKGDFFDLIGGADTLDEPDGLEPDTQFLTFRTPAGHPEVQDTNSYINYLVEHELEGNSSQVVRDRARRYFQDGTAARQVV